MREDWTLTFGSGRHRSVDFDKACLVQDEQVVTARPAVKGTEMGGYCKWACHQGIPMCSYAVEEERGSKAGAKPLKR